MLQPFEIFKPQYIARLLELKKRWLVSQSYPRGINHLNQIPKEPILLSDYDDPGLAKVHLNAIKHDRYAAILDLEKSQHQQKLAEMLSLDSQYVLYWSVVKSAHDIETRINTRWKEKMRRFIDTKTNWQIDRNTVVRPAIEVIFGELFIVLTYGSQRLRIKFAEIEKA